MDQKLDDKISDLKLQLKEVDSKIKANPLPKAPKKPSIPIRFPIVEAGRPYYFKLSALLTYTVLWLIIFFLVPFLFSELGLEIFLLLIISASLVTRIFFYSIELKKYNRLKRAHDSIKKKYDQKLEDYNCKYAKYKIEYEQYLKQKEVNDLNIRQKKYIQQELNDLTVVLEHSKKSNQTNNNRVKELSPDIIGRINRGGLNNSASKEEGKTNENESKINFAIRNAVLFISKLSGKKRDQILKLLKQVQKVQDSDLTPGDKSKKIKDLLWTKQSMKNKYIIGGLIGTIAGLFVFGTGGIGIAALGGAVGVWGFLTGTAAGVIVSSIIQNFEKNK